MMGVAVLDIDARKCCEVWLTMRGIGSDSRACAGKTYVGGWRRGWGKRDEVASG